MAGDSYLLALDQGTTSTRAILFDQDGRAVQEARRPLPQHFPQPGWVEHDAEDIWRDAVHCLREVLRLAGIRAGQVAGVGITNQRETTVLWDRASGAPLGRAIVWQDRRTAAHCADLIRAGHADRIAAITGLVVDPYFSGTKLAWLLDRHDPGRAMARSGRLGFGTIDCFLLWRLTGGVHRSDETNASRTLMWDLAAGRWSDEMLDLLDVPAALLPEVLPSVAPFGTLRADVLGAPVPVWAMAGDQQAAAFGQVCDRPGTVKATFGTGCFVVVNAGATPPRSRHRLLSTALCRTGGAPCFGLEGSIFMAGATVQWLRDGLGILRNAGESEAMAARARADARVHLVPAFAGIGAPHWDPDARGAILGLTRDSGPDEIVRAGLEAVGFQTDDLITAVGEDLADLGVPTPGVLRVDGGMTVNDWAMQFLADVTGLVVERPTNIETTALGAAFLAGVGAGVYADAGDVAALWRLDRRFEPVMSADERGARRAGWREAVSRVLTGRA